MNNPAQNASPARPAIGPSEDYAAERDAHGALILRNATGGEVLAEFLIHWGVPYVFGLSGSEEIGLWDALVDREERIKYVTCLHEQIAMAMADGYARASGKTPLVALHSIAGAAYAFGQMVASCRDRVPVVVACGHQSTDFRGHEGFLESPGLHAFPQHYTQWTWDILDASTIAATLRRATLLAEAPPGGPTFVTISKDLLERRVAQTEILPREKSLVSRAVLPPAEHVEAIVEGLLAAERPMILLGTEARREEVSGEVMAIAEAVGAHVATSWEMGMVYPTNHPSFVGSVLVQEPELPRQADAFWSLGSHMFKRPRNEGVIVGRAAKVFHTGQDWTEVARNYPVDSAALANIKSTAAAVLAALRTKDLDTPALRARRQRVLDFAAARKARLAEALAQNGDDRPIALRRLFSELDRAIAGDANLVLEVVTSFDIAQDYLTIDGNVPYEQRRRAFGTSSGVLGWGLGAAIGVAIGNPGRETWCLAGDGCANFGIQALWTAARYAAPVAYVIVNNGQYQANRMNMVRYPGRMAATGHYPGVSLAHPEIVFLSLARGYGVEGETVGAPGELAAAFARAKAALAQGRPYLVDVRVKTRFGDFDPDWHGRFSIADLKP
ncbi:MAG: thiamine pyrophosphate-binding protein [Zoogloeaceae bacterium]|nr:thiamine pyrophosphate-binding protein [Zoogloeaceae bacterium]MCK6384055.1 thiamine pyrophosphate-binding protein [Rhodocyclaceae bacterium]